MARKKTSPDKIDATGNRSPFRPSKRAIALEPRLMFDGAVAANADQVLNPSDASHDPVIVDKTAVSVDKPSTAEDLQLPLFTPDFFAEKTPLEIVFVDTSVPNWQQLAGAIKPGIEVILLDPSQDGIRQMADALGTRTGVTAVHLISHDDNGELRIEEITASVSNLSSTVQTDNLLHINEVITSGENPAQAAIDLAMNSAQEAIRSFLSDKSAADLFTFFNGQQQAPSEQWLETADKLRMDILTGRYTVKIELLSNAQIGGVFAAFTGEGPSGEATIFINKDWLATSPSQQAISRVLIEELGHSFDYALNGGQDTAGDEGEAFVSTVMNFDLSTETLERIAAENDHSRIYLDGISYEIEEASLTFNHIYLGTPSSNSEEASSITLTTELIGTGFKFTSGGGSSFSGNNVSGDILQYTDADGNYITVTGVASRQIKSGNTTLGIYFYDQATNNAYIMAVGDTTFSTTAGINVYRTSSDPVDTTLNALIVPNSPPVAVNDSVTLTESQTATGNVLHNDKDVNLDTLSLTGFTVGGSTGTLGSAFNIGGVGSITINSNGSYTFTPEAGYCGPVPAIEYTVTDGNGGTAKAYLSILITPVNDPPISENDSITVKAYDYTFLKLDDFGNYSDPDGNPLASIQITSLPTAGALKYYNSSNSTWENVTANQEFTPADISANKLRYYNTTTGSTSLQFKVSDGIVYSTAAYTLSITVETSSNDAPVANADTNIILGAVTGSTVSGNVLENDTDANNDLLSVDPKIYTTTVYGLETFTYTVFTVGNAITAGTYSISGNGIPDGATVTVSGTPSKTCTISTPSAISSGQSVTINGNSVAISTVTLTTQSNSVIALSSLPVGSSITSDMTVNDIGGLTFSSGTTANITNIASVTGGFTLVTLDKTFTGTLTANDDLSFSKTSISIPYTLTGNYGNLTINADGSYTYTVTADSVSDNSTDTFVNAYTANDGRGETASANVTIKLYTDSAAPVNNLPATTVTYGTPYIFAAGLSVSDANNNLSSTVLTVQHGTLTATNNGSGTVTGDGTSSITLSGTQAEINSMLATVAYTAASGFDTGTDTLQMVSTDSTGLKDTDTVSIAINTPSVTVTGTTVNEASPYLCFTVTGVIGQKVTLTLASGTATVGSDLLPNLEYYNGAFWVAYLGSPVSIPDISGSGNLFVRAMVLQDSADEGSETVQLTARNSGGVEFSASSTIEDDGTGALYTGAVSSGDLVTTTGTLDDDRDLSVSSISVNEASPYAVFTVTGYVGQIVSLALQSGTATVGTDTGNTIEYFNGSSWQTYSGPVTLTATTLLVRTTIMNDGTGISTGSYEGPESFGLIASNTGSKSFIGTAVIYDDGSGNYYPDNTNGANDPSATLDKDSAVTVTSLSPVDEESTYAMFTVTGTSGVKLTLDVNEWTTSLGAPLIEYSYDGSTNWTTYSSGSEPTAPADASGKGTFYVRVNITGEQESPAVYEGSEVFELVASTISASGSGVITQSDSATSKIVDDGTGKIYGPNFGDPPDDGESDLPTVSISASPASILEDAAGVITYTVTLSNESNFDTTITYALSGTATYGTDYTTTATGSLTIAAGSITGTFTVDPTEDLIYESDETVIATLTSASTNSKTLVITTATATGTITNDDISSGNVAPVNTVPGAQTVDEDTSLALSGISVDDTDGNLSTTQLTVSNGKLNVILSGAASISAGANNSETLTISGNQIDINNTLATLIYQSNLNFNGSDSLEVLSTDGDAATDTDTVAITVLAVNDPANLSSDTKNLTETDDAADISSSGTLTISDADSTEEFQPQTDTAGTYGTFSIDKDGAWTYTASSAHNEFAAGTTYTDSFDVFSADGTKTTVVINIAGSNDLPVASNTSLTTNENIPLNGSLPLATDIDGDTVTYTKGSDPAHGTVIVNTNGTFTYTPAPGYSGSDSFIYMISDGNGGSNSYTVSVSVIDNIPPVVPVITSADDNIGPVLGNVANGGSTNDTTPALSGTAEAHSTVNIYDGGTLIATVTADGSGTWTYTPAALADGTTHSFTVTATDADGNISPVSAPYVLTVDTTAPATPTVNAITTNDTTPTITGTATVGAGETLTVLVNGKTYTVGDGNLSLSGTAWTLNIPAADLLADGTYSVTATVTDSAGNATADATAAELLIETTAPVDVPPSIDFNKIIAPGNTSNRHAFPEFFNHEDAIAIEDIATEIDHFNELVRAAVYESPNLIREGRSDLFARLYGTGYGKEQIRPVIAEAADIILENGRFDKAWLFNKLFRTGLFARLELEQIINAMDDQDNAGHADSASITVEQKPVVKLPVNNDHAKDTQPADLPALKNEPATNAGSEKKIAADKIAKRTAHFSAQLKSASQKMYANESLPFIMDSEGKQIISLLPGGFDKFSSADKLPSAGNNEGNHSNARDRSGYNLLLAAIRHDEQ